MVHKGKTFTDVVEVLDYNHYEKCRFVKCRLVFRGGLLPVLSECTFNGECQWVFEDAAQRTMLFLTLLYHTTGSYGQELLNQFIQNIKTPPGAPTTAGPLQ